MDFASSVTLHDHISGHAANHPDRRFSHFAGGWRTWSEFDARVRAGASALAGLGVEVGDRVVLLMDNGRDLLEATQAVQRRRGVAVPCSPLYSADEASAVVANVEPRLILADAPNAEKARLARAAHPSAGLVEDVEGLLAGNPDGPGLDELPRPTDVALIMHTSGTTARPKGVVLTHANLLHNAHTIANAVSWRRDDVSLHFFPQHHANGGLSNLGPALLKGSSLVLEPTFSASRFSALLHEHQVTFTSINATHVKFLLNTPASRLDDQHPCGRMQRGLALDAALERTFEERFATHCLATYGCTESLGAVVYGSLDIEESVGSCGRPQPGYDVTVRDDEGGELPPGQVGRVHIRAGSPHGLSTGYFIDGTFEPIPHEGLLTNDLGSFDAAGCLHFVDRANDMIKRAGFNVAPAEVERVLSEVAGVAETAVVGIPDPLREERIVAFVVFAPDSALEEAVLLERAAAQLAPYKVPERILVVDELLTDNLGKVRRRQMRDLALELLGQGVA
jgi:crotonobetaine/carnitine-CoA ligase